MRIPESELIINPDGSIYHLNLKPGEIADTVITVGDPDRVAMVSSYFDTIEVKAQHREFITHTGTYKGKRLSVISTGIGPDNIDIVLNELDALVNINFDTREVKKELKSLSIIRLGTSGGLQPDIPVDSVVASAKGVGFDNLVYFYEQHDGFDKEFSKAFIEHTNWYHKNSEPYVIDADPHLLKSYSAENIRVGITTTNVGFYGPQGRILRLKLHDNDLNDKIASFNYNGQVITNLEMETGAIYAMASLLGHRALSLNCILANRPNGTFSENPKKGVQHLIEYFLEKFSSLE